MKYAQAKEYIHTGDIIAIHSTTWFSKVTKIVQKIAGYKDLSGVTHIGIAYWIQDVLYSVEMDGRFNVIRPLSQHAWMKYKIDIYKCPVKSEKIVSTFPDVINEEIKYSIFDLLKIALNILFKKNIQENKGNDFVCSTFISRWLQLCGWTIDEPMPSPAQLCKKLGNPILTIQE